MAGHVEGLGSATQRGGHLAVWCLAKLCAKLGEGDESGLVDRKRPSMAEEKVNESGAAPLKYAYTVLYVKDVDLSLRFYSAAFGLRRKLEFADKTWAELDTGSTSLAFTPLVQREAALVGGVSEHDEPWRPPVNVVLSFIAEQDSVDRVYRRAVEAGAVAVAPPERNSKPWGQFMAYVRDPDGVLIQIGTEVKQELRTEEKQVLPN